MPFAFTEQCVAVLASILKSEKAIKVNIKIVRIFNKMRQLLSSQKEILYKLEQLEKKGLEHDEKLVLIFKYRKQLEQAKQEELEFRSLRVLFIGNS